MKPLAMASKWILVVGGLLLAYEGFTGTDLVQVLFGSLEAAVDIVVFGGAAVLLGYRMLTMKGSK